MNIARFHPDNTIPKGEWIWVFGSNEAGRHGKGAAKVAHVNFNAAYGEGYGLTGNAYAIPTKDKRLQSLPIEVISGHVDEFLHFSRAHPKQNFFVTRVGCGLAGYTDDQIAPMFAYAPSNCSLPQEWATYLANAALHDLSAA